MGPVDCTKIPISCPTPMFRAAKPVKTLMSTKNLCRGRRLGFVSSRHRARNCSCRCCSENSTSALDQLSSTRALLSLELSLLKFDKEHTARLMRRERRGHAITKNDKRKRPYRTNKSSTASLSQMMSLPRHAAFFTLLCGSSSLLQHSI